MKVLVSSLPSFNSAKLPMKSNIKTKSIKYHASNPGNEQLVFAEKCSYNRTPIKEIFHPVHRASISSRPSNPSQTSNPINNHLSLVVSSRCDHMSRVVNSNPTQRRLLRNVDLSSSGIDRSTLITTLETANTSSASSISAISLFAQ